MQVANATDEQQALAEAGSSMYLSADAQKKLHFKAYPESVSRLNIMAKPTEKLHLSLTALAYSKWFSPSGTQADGGLVLNAGASYQLAKNINLSLVGKNLLGENAL